MKIAGIAACLAILMLLGIGIGFSSLSPTGQLYYRNVSIPPAPTDFLQVPVVGVAPYQPEGDYWSIPPLRFESSKPGERLRHRIVPQDTTLPTDFSRPKLPSPSKYLNYSPIKKASPMYLNSYKSCLDRIKLVLEQCYQNYVVAQSACPTEFTCTATKHTYHTCLQIYNTARVNCKRLYAPVGHNTSHYT